VAYPLRLATALAGYRFIQTEIEAIDVERHVVRTADGDLPYDHVVVAPGSVTNDYGIPGVAEHAVAMKWLADGEAVRKRVMRAYGRDDVLSLGDAAAFDYQGRPLPQLAQVAVMEAKAAARNVAALVRGQPAVPYVYRRKGDLIALGRTNAGAELALVRGSVVM